MDHMREDMTSRPETTLNQQTEEENWKELIDTGAQQPPTKRLKATPPLTGTGRRSGEQEQGGL